VYNLDTNEEVDMDLFFEAFENGEIIIDGRDLTKRDHEEISRKIAEYRAAHPKTPAREAVLA
jgi:hypothetical protein